MRCDGGEFRPVRQLDLESGAEDQEIDGIAAFRRRHNDMVGLLLQSIDRAFQMKMGLRECADTQDARTRRRRLRAHGIVEKAPLPVIRQTGEAVHHAPLPMPVNLLIRGRSVLRTNRSSRAAPASSAVAALSIAEAPAPTTPTRLPRNAAKSISSAVWAQNLRSMPWAIDGTKDRRGRRGPLPAPHGARSSFRTGHHDGRRHRADRRRADEWHRPRPHCAPAGQARAGTRRDSPSMSHAAPGRARSRHRGHDAPRNRRGTSAPAGPLPARSVALGSEGFASWRR